MDIKYFRRNFEQYALKNNTIYSLGESITELHISETEARLGIIFPKQIKLFYSYINGLSVENPKLVIFPIENLKPYSGKIPFSIINGSEELCFDISSRNNAGQWNIIHCKTGYLITLTFAHFWSNNIFTWVFKNRKIWEDVEY